MKQQALNKLVALAASLALAGCVAPGPLKTLDQPAATAKAARQGAGTVELRVLWPDFRAYGTQAIPNRATRVVVSLKHQDGSPVTDLSGAEIKPVEAVRGTYGYMDTYGMFSWELPQQEGVEITAELYADTQVIATAQRLIDVIAGFRSTVALDLVLPDAPTITSVSSPSFKVGDTLVLTGTNFGSDKGWQARVFLQEEYTDQGEPSPFGDSKPGYSAIPVYLPDEYVSVDSPTQITVTIPEVIRDSYRQGNLTDFFWGYFNGDRAKLTLGVTVDGVNTPRVEVAMPKEVGAKATISLEQGFDAPPHRPDDQRYKDLDLTDATFSVPVATGTQWVFEMGGDNYYYNRQKATVTLTDSEGNAHVKQEWEFGTPWEQDVNLNWGGEFTFLRRISAQGIGFLPDQVVTLPDTATASAKHIAFSNSDGALYDLWVVPEVGPVRMRRISVNGGYGGPNDTQLWRNVQEYRLIGFTPASAVK